MKITQKLNQIYLEIKHNISLKKKGFLHFKLVFYKIKVKANHFTQSIVYITCSHFTEKKISVSFCVYALLFIASVYPLC